VIVQNTACYNFAPQDYDGQQTPYEFAQCKVIVLYKILNLPVIALSPRNDTKQLQTKLIVRMPVEYLHQLRSHIS